MLDAEKAEGNLKGEKDFLPNEEQNDATSKACDQFRDILINELKETRDSKWPYVVHKSHDEVHEVLVNATLYQFANKYQDSIREFAKLYYHKLVKLSAEEWFKKLLLTEQTTEDQRMKSSKQKKNKKAKTKKNKAKQTDQKNENIVDQNPVDSSDWLNVRAFYFA